MKKKAVVQMAVGKKVKQTIRNKKLVISSHTMAICRIGVRGNMDTLARLHDELGVPLWELLPTEEELRGEPEVRREN